MEVANDHLSATCKQNEAIFSIVAQKVAHRVIQICTTVKKVCSAIVSLEPLSAFLRQCHSLSMKMNGKIIECGLSTIRNPYHVIISSISNYRKSCLRTYFGLS